MRVLAGLSLAVEALTTTFVAALFLVGGASASYAAPTHHGVAISSGPSCLLSGSVSASAAAPMQFLPFTLRFTVVSHQPGATICQAPLTYHWFGLPLGFTSANAAALTGVAQLPGTYHVTVVATSAVGNAIGSTTLSVTAAN